MLLISLCFAQGGESELLLGVGVEGCKFITFSLDCLFGDILAGKLRVFVQCERLRTILAHRHKHSTEFGSVHLWGITHRHDEHGLSSSSSSSGRPSVGLSPTIEQILKQLLWTPGVGFVATFLSILADRYCLCDYSSHRIAICLLGLHK